MTFGATEGVAGSPQVAQRATAVTRRLRWLGAAFGLAGIAFSAASGLGFERYSVGSASMTPTLECASAPGCHGLVGDEVLVNTWFYRLFAVERGDIALVSQVAARCGPGPFLKRVVGVPRDTIRIVGRAVRVNEARAGGTGDNSVRMLRSLTLGRNQYFLVGDHNRSCDSRTFGPVTRAAIIGRAFLIVSPIRRVKLLAKANWPSRPRTGGIREPAHGTS